MEQNDLKMIDSIISTTDDPQVKEMLQSHKRETEEHERGACARGWTPWAVAHQHENRPRRWERHF